MRLKYYWPDIYGKLNNGKLFARGNLQTDFLPSQLPVPRDHRDVKLAESHPTDDNGGVFQGFAACVTSIQDLSDVRQELLMSTPSVQNANNIIYAYKYNGGSTVHENFDSDGDHSVGYNLLRSMREKDICDHVFDFDFIECFTTTFQLAHSLLDKLGRMWSCVHNN